MDPLPEGFFYNRLWSKRDTLITFLKFPHNSLTKGEDPTQEIQTYFD